MNLIYHNRYGSDIDLAKLIVIKIASETLSEFTTNSKSQWKDIVNKYYIEDYQIPFAIQSTEHKYNFTTEPEVLRYQVSFSPNTPESYPAIGLFQIDKDKKITHPF